MNHVCPCCGWNPRQKLSIQVENLMIKREVSTESLINEVADIINKYLYTNRMPITNKEKFIIGISRVKDEVVREGIDKYIKDEWFKKGYDFPYLGKVIRNLSISKVMKKDKEEKRIGNNPPEL